MNTIDHIKLDWKKFVNRKSIEWDKRHPDTIQVNLDIDEYPVTVNIENHLLISAQEGSGAVTATRAYAEQLFKKGHSIFYNGDMISVYAFWIDLIQSGYRTKVNAQASESDYPKLKCIVFSDEITFEISECGPNCYQIFDSNNPLANKTELELLDTHVNAIFLHEAHAKILIEDTGEIEADYEALLQKAQDLNINSILVDTQIFTKEQDVPKLSELPSSMPHILCTQLATENAVEYPVQIHLRNSLKNLKSFHIKRKLRGDLHWNRLGFGVLVQPNVEQRFMRLYWFPNGKAHTRSKNPNLIAPVKSQPLDD